MENLIENIMTIPNEALAMFDILRNLVQEAEGERFENLIGGVQILDEDTIRVCLVMLISVTSMEMIDQSEANFMEDIHSIPQDSKGAQN